MLESDQSLRWTVEAGKRHIWHPLLQHSVLERQDPLVIKRAHGAYVVDADGREYLDAMSGLFCVNIGYGRKEVAEAVYRQMLELPYYPLTQLHEAAVRLTTLIAPLLPQGLDRFFFTNSGSEAVETALKIARQAARQRHLGENRYKIISRYRAYHGFTMGALSATGQPIRRAAFEPLVPGFLHVPPPDRFRCSWCAGQNACTLACADEFEHTIVREGPTTVAAVIAEPVIGGGGIFVPHEEYFPRLRKICDQYGVLLILDEVITGFGRLGTPFGCQAFGVVPDMITVAKGITSAYAPLGACIAARHVFDAFYGKPGEGRELAQVSTFGGHPVACAAGVANMEILTTERLWENARTVGGRLLEALMPLRGRPGVGDVRGKGLLLGIELVGPDGRTPADEARMAAVLGKLRANGILAGRNSYTVGGFNNVLILAPPLILTQDEADHLASAVAIALRETAAS